jgi:hypothetical protein
MSRDTYRTTNISKPTTAIDPSGWSFERTRRNKYHLRQSLVRALLFLIQSVIAKMRLGGDLGADEVCGDAKKTFHTTILLTGKGTTLGGIRWRANSQLRI